MSDEDIRNRSIHFFYYEDMHSHTYFCIHCNQHISHTHTLMHTNILITIIFFFVIIFITTIINITFLSLSHHLYFFLRFPQPKRRASFPQMTPRVCVSLWAWAACVGWALLSVAAADLPPPERQYSILFLLPMSSTSHRNIFMSVAEALAERGHNVSTWVRRGRLQGVQSHRRHVKGYSRSGHRSLGVGTEGKASCLIMDAGQATRRSRLTGE